MARKILASLLEQLILDGGSDLHLRSGKQPRIRVDGNLRTLDHPPLQPSLIHDLADIILGASPKNRPGMKGETDLSFQFGGCRFRVNFFYQLSNPAMALRLIPETVGTFRELVFLRLLKNFASAPMAWFLWPDRVARERLQLLRLCSKASISGSTGTF